MLKYTITAFYLKTLDDLKLTVLFLHAACYLCNRTKQLGKAVIVVLEVEIHMPLSNAGDCCHYACAKPDRLEQMNIARYFLIYKLKMS